MKKIRVVGCLSDRERDKRDNGRIPYKGCMYSLKSHISVDKPLVIVKNYEKNNKVR